MLESQFKGLSDIALGEAKRLGCTYADIRFTRNINDAVGVRDRIVTDGGGFGGRRPRRERRLRRARHPQRRVGLCQQPVRHRGRDQEDHRAGDRRGQGQRREQALRGQLAPVEAYTDYWAVPVKIKPDDVSLDDKIAFLMQINEVALKQPDVIRVQSQIAFDFEWKYLATSEGSYIEQEIWRTLPSFTVTARKGNRSSSAPSPCAPKTAGLRGGARRARCSRTSSASAPRRPSTARRRRSASGSRTWS